MQDHPPIQSSRFLIPVHGVHRWGWILFGLGSIIFNLILSLFVFFALKNYLAPLVNLLLFFGGTLTSVGAPFLYFKDGLKIRKAVGWSFEGDGLRIHTMFFEKVVALSGVQKIDFYPAIVNVFKKTPQRAFVRLHLEKQVFTLVIPFYEESLQKLQELKIPVKVHRKTLLLVPVFVLISALLSHIPFLLLYAYAVITKYQSKNGFLTRRTELAMPVYFLGLFALLVAAGPLSRPDRQFAEISQAIRNGDQKKVSSLCEHTSKYRKIAEACAQPVASKPEPRLNRKTSSEAGH